jgi:hypothetical protein
MKAIGVTAAAVLTAMIALAGPASARLGIAPSPVSQDDAVIQVRGGGHGHGHHGWHGGRGHHYGWFRGRGNPHRHR